MSTSGTIIFYEDKTKPLSLRYESLEERREYLNIYKPSSPYTIVPDVTNAIMSQKRRPRLPYDPKQKHSRVFQKEAI